MKIGVTSMVFFARPLEEICRWRARLRLWRFAEHFWRHDECLMPEGSEMSWMRWALRYRPLSCDGCQYHVGEPDHPQVSIAQTGGRTFCPRINVINGPHPVTHTASLRASLKRQFETVCRAVKEAKSLGVQIDWNMRSTTPGILKRSCPSQAHRGGVPSA